MVPTAHDTLLSVVQAATPFVRCLLNCDGPRLVFSLIGVEHEEVLPFLVPKPYW